MIDKIILPYVKKQIKSLGLRKNQEWLLIADVFKGQWTPAVKKKVADLNEKMVPVPNNTTNHFQTLKLTVNRSEKAYLRAHKIKSRPSSYVAISYAVPQAMLLRHG